MDVEVGSRPTKLKEPLSGILTPLTIIEGHIQSYKEDWTKIIKNYSDNISRKKIEQKYFAPLSSTALWRLWGPSIEKLSGKNYEICQFGEGDEYNSIPILIDREILIENEILFNSLKKGYQKFVSPINTKGIIVSLKNKEINFF